MKMFMLLLIGFCPLVSKAQLTPHYSETGYNYWLYLPNDSILKNNPPLLVFLHGRSLSGTDLNKVKKYGVIHEIEKGREIPAVVIAPQVSSGSWNPDKIMELVNQIEKKYNTDTTRLYVCGMSMGGYGTMHFAGAYSEEVAAAVALCGGGNENDACELANIPFWIQHGTADEAVPVAESRKMRDAIVNCNGGELLIYREIEGANHGAMERVFRSDELYDWLFKHQK